MRTKGVNVKKIVIKYFTTVFGIWKDFW